MIINKLHFIIHDLGFDYNLINLKGECLGRHFSIEYIYYIYYNCWKGKSVLQPIR